MINKTGEFVKELAKKHFDAIEELTKEQFEDALLQAIKSGDFIRCVEHCIPNLHHKQGVVYVPYAQVLSLQLQFDKLKQLKQLKDRVKEMSKKYAGCEILTREFPELFKDLK